MTDINLFITLAGTARHDHRYTEWQGAGGWQEGGGVSVVFGLLQCSVLSADAGCRLSVSSTTHTFCVSKS